MIYCSSYSSPRLCPAGQLLTPGLKGSFSFVSRFKVEQLLHMCAERSRQLAREKRCFEVGVIYNRRQPSAGVSKEGGRRRRRRGGSKKGKWEMRRLLLISFLPNLQGKSVKKILLGIFKMRDAYIKDKIVVKANSVQNHIFLWRISRRMWFPGKQWGRKPNSLSPAMAPNCQAARHFKAGATFSICQFSQQSI